MRQRYLVALGSNVRHHRHGLPPQVLAAALSALAAAGVTIESASPVLSSAPIGPSRRRYANSAAVIATLLDPEDLLALLKQIECAFGRRQHGERWTARVLDLDIVLWSVGAWSSSSLTIPHPAFRVRPFVLDPSVSIAAMWRDPLSHLTLRQLRARLTRPRPLPR
jgi:2-amino-4-hydroxy-6-hydroxymethyldihydropteridine diphosphokinase